MKIKQWVKDTTMHQNRQNKNHVMKTKSTPKVVPMQQKRRRITILVHEGAKRIEQTKNHTHILKLDKNSDKQFISPIVITVKKDQTVKLVLDSKIINKFI